MAADGEAQLCNISQAAKIVECFISISEALTQRFAKQKQAANKGGYRANKQINQQVPTRVPKRQRYLGPWPDAAAAKRCRRRNRHHT